MQLILAKPEEYYHGKTSYDKDFKTFMGNIRLILFIKAKAIFFILENKIHTQTQISNEKCCHTYFLYV